MNWQGKIDFSKPITLNGKPHGIEQLTSLPTWTSGDQGRVIYSMNTGKLWVGTLTGWEDTLVVVRIMVEIFLVLELVVKIFVLLKMV